MSLPKLTESILRAGASAKPLARSEPSVDNMRVPQ
jgi:hypothetical protein